MLKNKVWLWGIIVLGFSCSLLFIKASAYTNEIEHELFSVSTPDLTAGSVSVGTSDSEKIQALTALVVMYSEQLEEYDRSNGGFVVTCITLAGVILGLSITLFTAQKKKITRPNWGLSALFSLIPCVMTLCLYVFSMQCRRVAFFRGYLTYLEAELSNFLGTNLIFNSNVVGKYFGEFTTNKCGPLVMAIFVLALLIVSIGFSLYFATSTARPYTWRQKFSYGALGVILLTCIIYCVVCVYDLASNGNIPADVYAYCAQFVK